MGKNRRSDGGSDSPNPTKTSPMEDSGLESQRVYDLIKPRESSMDLIANYTDEKYDNPEQFSPEVFLENYDYEQLERIEDDLIGFYKNARIFMNSYGTDNPYYNEVKNLREISNEIREAISEELSKRNPNRPIF